MPNARTLMRQAQPRSPPLGAATYPRPGASSSATAGSRRRGAGAAVYNPARNTSPVQNHVANHGSPKGSADALGTTANAPLHRSVPHQSYYHLQGYTVVQIVTRTPRVPSALHVLCLSTGEGSLLLGCHLYGGRTLVQRKRRSFVRGQDDGHTGHRPPVARSTPLAFE